MISPYDKRRQGIPRELAIKASATMNKNLYAHPTVIRILLMVLCSVSCPRVLTAQTLDLPPHPSGAPGGDAFAASVTTLTRDQRDEQIFEQVIAGNVPDFLRRLIPMTSTATIDGRLRVARWYVTPEYVAIGNNDDYFLMPMTPLLAQRIADAIGCTLPTRKMVDAIYAAASVKVAPIPIPPSAAMITVPVFKQHNDTLRSQRVPLLEAHPLGELVAGHKKDVIVSNAITTDLKPTVPKPVVIYGWHQLNGVPIQPLYNGHEQTYADYSHGIRLVQRAVLLDGAATMIDDIVRDSVLWPLFSDEGILAHPRYGDPSTDVPREDTTPMTPKESELLQNYPNPFNPSTTISYKVPEAGNRREAIGGYGFPCATCLAVRWQCLLMGPGWEDPTRFSLMPATLPADFISTGCRPAHQSQHDRAFSCVDPVDCSPRSSVRSEHLRERHCCLEGTLLAKQVSGSPLHLSIFEKIPYLWVAQQL